MPLGITKGITTWNSQQRTVERFTDNAAYTSAHPDDTLILAGPPRKSDMQEYATSGPASLLAIGMQQGFTFSSQKPTQPMQAIGSGRTFFVSAKSQNSWQIARLFCNGRNLLRVLYHNAVAGNLPVQDFDDSPVVASRTEMFFINLDSELFYIPTGIGMIYRDKAKNLIGAGYLELCMTSSYSLGFNAGQAAVMENVTGLCDRVVPFRPTAVATAAVPRATIDAVVGFVNGDNMPTNGTGLDDLNLDRTDVSQ
jgi:hypothetical protein